MTATDSSSKASEGSEGEGKEGIGSYGGPPDPSIADLRKSGIEHLEAQVAGGWEVTIPQAVVVSFGGVTVDVKVRLNADRTWEIV
jgi:hypothetical protein